LKGLGFVETKDVPMTGGFFAFDIDRARRLQNLQLLFVHLDLMRMERAVLWVAIVGLACLERNGVVIARDRDQSIQLGIRDGDGVRVLIDLFRDRSDVRGRRRSRALCLRGIENDRKPTHRCDTGCAGK
jgi:hypothetical protein